MTLNSKALRFLHCHRCDDDYSSNNDMFNIATYGVCSTCLEDRLDKLINVKPTQEEKEWEEDIFYSQGATVS